jgi:hypothetical protein
MNRSRVLRRVSRRDARTNSPDEEFGVFSSAALEEQPIWTTLCEDIRDALFPHKLPPLELTSKPFPTPDRMTVKTNPWAVGSSTILNGLILTLLVILGMRVAINQTPKPASSAPIDLSDFRVFAPATASGNGGSGGSNDPVAPIDGRKPKFENMPLAPPLVPVIQQPKLAERDACLEWLWAPRWHRSWAGWRRRTRQWPRLWPRRGWWRGLFPGPRSRSAGSYLRS